MEKDMKVTVVIPTRNEEPTIAEIIEGCKPYADEILVIDGHSTDRTREIAKELGVRVEFDVVVERKGRTAGRLELGENRLDAVTRGQRPRGRSRSGRYLHPFRPVVFFVVETHRVGARHVEVQFYLDATGHRVVVVYEKGAFQSGVFGFGRTLVAASAYETDHGEHEQRAEKHFRHGSLPSLKQVCSPEPDAL